MRQLATSEELRVHVDRMSMCHACDGISHVFAGEQSGRRSTEDALHSRSHNVKSMTAKNVDEEPITVQEYAIACVKKFPAKTELIMETAVTWMSGMPVNV